MKSTSNQAKHVSFTDDLPPIDSNSEGTDHSISADLWYSPQDFELFRQELSVEEEKPGGVIEKEDEDAYNKISEQRHQAQRYFIQCFLKQQDEHRQLGIKDPRGLYQFSKAMSKNSKCRALENGKSVEKECAISKEELVHAIDYVLDLLEG